MPNQRFGVDAGQDLTIFMGTEDEPFTLHLTYDEARRLASWLRQEIAHGFEGEERRGTINVADVPCDHCEAAELLMMIEIGLGPEDDLDDVPLDHDRESSGGDFVNWLVEGF